MRKMTYQEYQEMMDRRAEELEKPWHQRQWEKAEVMADDDRDSMYQED